MILSNIFIFFRTTMKINIEKEKLIENVSQRYAQSNTKLFTA